MPIDTAALQPSTTPAAVAVRPRQGERRTATAKEKTGDRPWYARLAQLEISGPQRITDEHLVILTRQLALLLESGNGLVPSLKAFSRQATSPLLKAVLEDIALRIEEGRSLSEALELHPKHFDRFFISIVQAGEAAGELRQSLEHLGGAFETRVRLRTRIIEALTYPAVLAGVMGAVLIFVFTYMLPRFSVLFADFAHELPWTTRGLLWLSAFLQSSWYWVIPIVILCAVAVFRLWGTERFQATRDRLKLSIPFVKRLYEESYLFQLFLSLGLLLGSRVPHLLAISIARHTVRNVRYRAFFSRLEERVEAGAGMSQAFLEAPFLPETVKLMVSTGEEAGTLDDVMVRLSKKYQEDLESDIRRLSSMLEPLMLVVMGVAVGGIAMSLIIPIFKLSRTVQ